MCLYCNSKYTDNWVKLTAATLIQQIQCTSEQDCGMAWLLIISHIIAHVYMDNIHNIIRVMYLVTIHWYIYYALRALGTCPAKDVHVDIISHQQRTWEWHSCQCRHKVYTVVPTRIPDVLSDTTHGILLLVTDNIYISLFSCTIFNRSTASSTSVCTVMHHLNSTQMHSNNSSLTQKVTNSFVNITLNTNNNQSYT